jgi:hypothetical protein
MRSAVDPSVHAVVIRNRSAALHAARGQRCEWVTHDRSRIPGGIFARLWAAHVDRLAERPPSLSIPPSVSVRKLAKVAGRLLSMGLAVGPTCRLMSREMFAAMYSNDIQDWDGWVASNIGLVRELLWVVRHLCAWNNIGTPIWRDESCVDVVVTQDSSPTGVGFRLESPHAGKRVVVEGSIDFTTAESRLDHVHRELVGAVLAVFRAAPHLRGLCVQLRVDSKSTVKYIRDCGGRSRFMTRLTRILFGFCIRNRISLFPMWIPGTLMVDCGVDGLSRLPPPLPPYPQPIMPSGASAATPSYGWKPSSSAAVASLP